MFRYYKVVLVGDPRVGKTAFKRCFKSCEYPNRYEATIGAEVDAFEVKKGEVIFNVWDIAGQDKYAGLRSDMYKDAHAAIVMFDLTDGVSYEHVEQWTSDIRAVCPNIPILIVGNKADEPHDANLPHVKVSARTCLDIIEPFQELLNRL